MARFFGEVGLGESVQVKKGVWEDQITERPVYGTERQAQLASSTANSVLPEARFQTMLSVMADADVFEKYTAIRYVRYAGSLWTVTSVKKERPRLILMLGEVYHGPTA